MKKIIRITESHLNSLIENEILSGKNIISESISIKGAKIIPVKIDWNGPEGKHSGQLKIIYGNKTIYYKMTVDHFLYSGSILITNIWENGDGYKVKDNTGKVFPLTKKEMGNIVDRAILEYNTFTIKGDATVKFDKTS